MQKKNIQEYRTDVLTKILGLKLEPKLVRISAPDFGAK